MRESRRQSSSIEEIKARKAFTQEKLRISLISPCEIPLTSFSLKYAMFLTMQSNGESRSKRRAHAQRRYDERKYAEDGKIPLSNLTQHENFSEAFSMYLAYSHGKCLRIKTVKKSREICVLQQWNQMGK